MIAPWVFQERWYLMGMGTEVELHTPHWHGATHCHVNDHIVAGMMAQFTITP